MSKLTEHEQTMVSDIRARLDELDTDKSLYWAYMKMYRTAQRLEQLMTDVRIRLDAGADVNYTTHGKNNITNIAVNDIQTRRDNVKLYTVTGKDGKPVKVSVPDK